MAFEPPIELNCDTCGAPAPSPVASIHLLPWCEKTERAEIAGECDCDPGGYWFKVHSWATELSREVDPDSRFTMRDQLMTKRDGAEAIAIVDKRLGIFRPDVTERERRQYAEREANLKDLFGDIGEPQL